MSGFLSVLYVFLIILHVIVCTLMILIILLQAGRSAGLGAGFGGASQTIFGAGGGTEFLMKFTAGLAIIFTITSVGIAKISSPGKSDLEKQAEKMAKKISKGEEVNLDELNEVLKKKEEKKQIPPTDAGVEGDITLEFVTTSKDASIYDYIEITPDAPGSQTTKDALTSP